MREVLVFRFLRSLNITLYENGTMPYYSNELPGAGAGLLNLLNDASRAETGGEDAAGESQIIRMPSADVSI